MIAMMKFDLPALKFWESGRVMKMERASDTFWPSIRDGFPINSQMFPVSLTGHQRQQSAVMPKFGGGTASGGFPSAEAFHRAVYQITAFIGTTSPLDAWLWDVCVGSLQQRES